jgi:hypothetical protein
VPPAGDLASFGLISFVLIIVPGPNVLFVISRSLMLGRADHRPRLSFPCCGARLVAASPSS